MYVALLKKKKKIQYEKKKRKKRTMLVNSLNDHEWVCCSIKHRWNCSGCCCRIGALAETKKKKKKKKLQCPVLSRVMSWLDSWNQDACCSIIVICFDMQRMKTQLYWNWTLVERLRLLHWLLVVGSILACFVILFFFCSSGPRKMS